MTGPPTPPPISETELQDQARTEASTAPPVPAPAPAPPTATQSRQPTQDAYHFILPKIADLAGQGEFSELIRVAENADLNAGYSCYVMGHDTDVRCVNSLRMTDRRADCCLQPLLFLHILLWTICA
jgi:hypothetical protein